MFAQEDRETQEPGSFRTPFPTLAREGQPAGQLHTRHTARTGRIHFKGENKALPGSVTLLLDNGPLVQRRFSPSTLASNIDTLEHWCRIHQLKLRQIEAGGLPWGEKLWKSWLDALKGEASGSVVIASDFHGPAFEGQVALELQARHNPAWCRIVHPVPQVGHPQIFVNLANPQQRHRFDPESFERAHREWEAAWLKKARSTGIPTALCTGSGPEDLVFSLLKLYTGDRRS